MPDKALLLGINNYQSISDLRGCINDVENVKQLLFDEMGFKDEEQVRVLTDEKVVLRNVKRGFDWLYEDAQDGDRLLFHFSGHGSYITSTDDDEPVDELLCLWDMDWDDEGSYLIDDDLGEFTEGLPEGAHLTVVLDNCHSGGGTRFISGSRSFRTVSKVDSKCRLLIVEDAMNSAPPAKRSHVRELLNDEKASFKPDNNFGSPFARFIFPPKTHRDQKNSGPMRKLGRSLDKLNHTLLAGARDDQTAADAFIQGEYQGAFSYYLCKATRSQPKASVKEIMESVTTEVKNAGHSQVPQLQGINQNEKFLGGTATGEKNPSSAAGLNTVPISSIESDGSADGRLAIANRLISVQEKFLDLTAALLAGEPSSSGVSLSGITSARTDGEVVVYVHGINQHPAGYSIAWFDAMSPYLTRTIKRDEVVWSDLVNPRSGSRPALSAETNRFKESLLKEIEKREKEVEGQVPEDMRPRTLSRGDGMSIDDFVRYMTIESTREAILKRFDDVVRPYLASGSKVHIIAHSWGTVVAYEGMRRLDSVSLPGKVKNLIYAGSALSFDLVESNLFGRVTDGRRPIHVNSIANIDAGGDIVGGPIGDSFVVDFEKDGIEPHGCTTIPFTDIAFSPTCAHRSYFKSGNKKVNRDIFAKRING